MAQTVDFHKITCNGPADLSHAQRLNAAGNGCVTSRRGRITGPVDDALAAAGLTRNVAVVVPSFGTALSTAAATDMVALIPASYFEHLRASTALCSFELPVPTEHITISQMWHPRYAQVRASRITHVGELGWELYIPAEFAMHVFEKLMAVGPEFGLQFAGMHAMNACRMEKAYRHWGDDISVEDTPIKAGLGFAVAWDKPFEFVGKDALLRQRAEGFQRQLLQFRLTDTDRLLYKEEPIWMNGKRAGAITSGMYGHRVYASLGMGYVRVEEPMDQAWIAAQRFEIEIGWERYEAHAQFDPSTTRRTSASRRSAPQHVATCRAA